MSDALITASIVLVVLFATGEAASARSRHGFVCYHSPSWIGSCREQKRMWKKMRRLHLICGDPTIPGQVECE